MQGNQQKVAEWLFSTFMGYRPKDKRKEDSEDTDIVEVTTTSRGLSQLLQEVMEVSVRKQ